MLLWNAAQSGLRCFFCFCFFFSQQGSSFAPFNCINCKLFMMLLSFYCTALIISQTQMTLVHFLSTTDCRRLMCVNGWSASDWNNVFPYCDHMTSSKLYCVRSQPIHAHVVNCGEWAYDILRGTKVCKCFYFAI